jgi:hypothetical protein
MARIRFRRDSPGLDDVLQSIDFGQIAAAETIAAIVREHRGAEVIVDTYTTDRLAAAVTIRDVRGRAWEARDGVLTRAAAAVGLEVTSR